MSEPEVKFEKPLTPEQIAKGRQIMLAQLVAFDPVNAATYNRLFGDDDPARLAPSEDVAGKMAYCPDPKNPKRRTKTTLGRYLRRNVKMTVDAYTEGAVSRAMIAVTAIYPVEGQFTILTGEDLRKAYYDKVGSDSCMAGPDRERQERLGFYVRNPEQIGLLVWKGTQGRALLWTGDDGKLFIDRVYAGDLAAAHEAYWRWAEGRNAWMYDKGGYHKIKNFVCTVKAFEGPRPPYFDSLQLSGVKLFLGCPVCPGCGKQHEPGSLKKVNDKEICELCVSLYGECESCKKAEHKRNLYPVVSGGVACAVCIDKHYRYCHGCGAYGDSREEGQVVHESDSKKDYCKKCAGNVAALVAAG